MAQKRTHKRTYILIHTYAKSHVRSFSLFALSLFVCLSSLSICLPVRLSRSHTVSLSRCHEVSLSRSPTPLSVSCSCARARCRTRALMGCASHLHAYNLSLKTSQDSAKPSATHCNTLQHAATRCNTLQHAETPTHSKPAKTRQHSARHCSTL